MASRTVGCAVAVLAAAGLVLRATPLNAQAEATAVQRTQRYQIGMMERVLENAVEHGATITRDRLRALMPTEMLLAESAEARGFRLQGYGVFFDVVVPNLEGMLPWVFRTLDRTDLGIDNALQTLRTMVERGGDAERQALRRLELQIAPLSAINTATGGQAPAASPAVSRQPADPILNNPEEAYRAEVMAALMDAMLDHSRALELGTDEWLTIGARRSESPRIAGDTPARTIQIGVRGADLQAFLAGTISREEARRRMDVRVF